MSLSAYIKEQVHQVLSEDIGNGDLTAALIPQALMVEAVVITRQPAVIAGCAWVNEVFQQLNPKITLHWFCKDGDQVDVDDVLFTVIGDARNVLTGERVALNFLQTLSAVATKTKQFVDLVKGVDVKILDTRKTIPGLRLAQKYAVTCGGGVNHRIGLYDAILIKENHISAAGSIALAFQQAQSLVKEDVSIEIEVESLDEMEQALEVGVERLLLDNFSLSELKAAVELNKKFHKQARLEASGNVSLMSIREIAETGIDDISVGELTKNVEAIDLSMRFVKSDKEV